MIKKHIRFLLWLTGLCFMFSTAIAQVPAGRTTIIVENTDHIIVQKEDSIYVKYLNGNIRMYHAGNYFYCDTAVLYQNSFKAFGHVVILQEDQTTVFADTIHYDGDSRLSSLTGRVLVRKENRTLRTRILDYDVGNKIGKYQSGAQLSQDSSLLKSLKGTYFVNDDLVQFRHHVSIIDSSFTLKADSLDFNTRTKVAVFLSPTYILQDSSSIYCEKGFYDIENKVASFEQNPLYREKDVTARGNKIVFEDIHKSFTLAGNAYYREPEQEATADTIIYFTDLDKTILIGNVNVIGKNTKINGKYVEYFNETGKFVSLGRSSITEDEIEVTADVFDIREGDYNSIAMGNVVFYDSLSKMKLFCETIESDEGNNRFKAFSDTLSRPFMQKLMQSDTLFLSSDTLYSYELVTEPDTFRFFDAYHAVEIFHKNFQGISDFMNFNGKDSVFTLIDKPLLWRDSTQFSADTIQIFLKDDKVDQLLLTGNAMIIEAENDDLFNQIGGKTILAGFENDTLKTMEIMGNAQSLYYMKDEAGQYTGAILTSCSRITFVFANDDIKDIRYFENPGSKMTPMSQELQNPQKLDGFNWLIEKKPTSAEYLMKDWSPLRKIKITERSTPEIIENEKTDENPDNILNKAENDEK